MNPDIHKQLRELKNQLKQLEDAAQHLVNTAKEEREGKEQVVQDHWTAQRQLATIRQLEEDYTELESETLQYKQSRARLTIYLRDLLTKTKALRQGINAP